MDGDAAGIDAKVCPLCRRPNGCRAGDPSCWCNSISVPPGLLALIPPESVMKACICRDCIQAYKADPAAFDARRG